MAAQRYSIDCSQFPSEKSCTLKMSGREDELLEAAVQHAVSLHGHQDTKELRGMIRAAFKEEAVVS